MKQKTSIATIIAIIMVIFSTNNAFSDEEVLFGGQIENGGFGGPHVSFGQINDEMGLFVGGRGAWVIDHKISIGFGGLGLVSNHRVKDYTQEVSYWDYNGNGGKVYKIDSSWYISDFGYGGFIFEYIHNSNRIVHFTASLLIGGGHMAYYHDPISSENNNYYYDWESEYYEYKKKSSDFFVLEPAVNAEFNIAKWFRIDAGLSYRIVTSLDMPATTNAQISGISGNIIFKFGKF